MNTFRVMKGLLLDFRTLCLVRIETHLIGLIFLPATVIYAHFHVILETGNKFQCDLII